MPTNLSTFLGSSFAGAQGAQGTAGSQGAQGTAGSQGAQGTAGSQGAQGASGVTGAFSQTFTSPGTFVVGTNTPSTVTSIRISCMGGGGNGLAQPYGGGGGSSVLAITTRTVSNGQSYSITVGGGGGTSSVTFPAGPAPTTIISVPSGTPGSSPPGDGTGPPAPAAPITPTGASYAFRGNAGSGGFSNPSQNYIGAGGDSVLGTASPLSGFGAGAPGNATGRPGIVIIEW